MEIAKVIGSKIEKVKEKHGLSNEKIGELLGVTRQTIAKYISGEQVIDSAKLFKLSAYCNVPITYFLEEESTTLSFMFRADNPGETFDEATAMMINKKLLSYCDLLRLHHGGADVYLPESQRIMTEGKMISRGERQKIAEAAERVRRTIRLEDEMDIYRVLEEQGIAVYAMSLDRGLDGLSAYSEEKGAFILINDREDIAEEQKRFSCAHELGHLILHRDDYKRTAEELRYVTPYMDHREHMANVFANHLLIPRHALHKAVRNLLGARSSLDASDLLVLKRRFGVSAGTVLSALREEGYLSSEAETQLQAQLHQKFGDSEPSPMPPVAKNGKLMSILRNLVKGGEITTNKVAEMLDKTVMEARVLIKSWVDTV